VSSEIRPWCLCSLSSLQFGRDIFTKSTLCRKLQSLKPQLERTDYFDSTLPGFCLRVTPRGVKSFSVLYRHAGRLRRYTIGKYPKLSLVDARNEAREALREAALGNDPATKKQQVRQTGTFGELAKEYIERWAKKNKRSWVADQQLLDQCLLATR
jgi:hypothetical protein